MTGISAMLTASRRSFAYAGLALALGLGGCGSIDEALFGGSGPAPSQIEAGTPPPAQTSTEAGTFPAPEATETGTESGMAGTLPPGQRRRPAPRWPGLPRAATSRRW
jgi:hypothetical protein